MATVGYLFPGQGAQYVGMGKDVYDNFSCARDIFHQASDLLGFDIAQLCFEGPADRLKETENSQPAILTTSIAIFSAINPLLSRNFNSERTKGEFSGTQASALQAVAGLSLGEYCALVGAESISFLDAVRLVRKRGEFMRDAAVEFPGGMVSIIGLPYEKVDKICQECGTEIANLNCPGQIVISGKNDALSQATDKAKSKGAKKVIFLDVSGAFHSSLMNTASLRMEEELRNVNISSPKVSVISNVTAKPENSPEEIRSNLVTQINHFTRWEESMKFLISSGINKFLEIGPGKVLKGLMRRIAPTVEVYSIETGEDIANLK